MTGESGFDQRGSPKRSITITEAIRAVMRDSTGPMSPAEAYHAIVVANLYTFNTDDPVSMVRLEMRRRCVGLDFQSARPTKYFQATIDGRYALIDAGEPRDMASPRVEAKERSLLAQVEELQDLHEREVRTHALEILKGSAPNAFERFAGRLLTTYGFEQVVTTRASRDGGIDGHGQLHIGLTTINVAFQCKRYRDKAVGPDVVESFRGRISGRYDQGYFFTTSRFTREALDAQRRPGAVPIVLFDGGQIVDIMFEKELGICFRELRLPKINMGVILDE